MSRNTKEVLDDRKTPLDLEGDSRPKEDLEGDSKPKEDLEGDRRPKEDLEGDRRPKEDLERVPSSNNSLVSDSNYDSGLGNVFSITY